jgi:hypothetical protein
MSVAAQTIGSVFERSGDPLDTRDDLPRYREANARIRREGTRNLLEAAPGARVVADEGRGNACAATDLSGRGLRG